MSYGFFLHDIGKVGDPRIDPAQGRSAHRARVDRDALPSRPGRADHGPIPFMGEAVEIVRSHHERLDGRGYPRGLRGEDIPLAARIFAIADSFDAMTSDRPYRSAMSTEAAVAEITAGIEDPVRPPMRGGVRGLDRRRRGRLPPPREASRADVRRRLSPAARLGGRGTARRPRPRRPQRPRRVDPSRGRGGVRLGRTRGGVRRRSRPDRSSVARARSRSRARCRSTRWTSPTTCPTTWPR